MNNTDQQSINATRNFVMQEADEMRLWEFMTHDQKRARVLLKLRDVGSRDTLALADSLKAKMAELFPPGSGIVTEITGDAYVDAVGLTEMIHELLVSILTAALVIFGLIALLFRSVRIGLITIPPNVIPLVVTFGYMGLRRFRSQRGQRDRVHNQPGDRRRQYDPLHPALPRGIRQRSAHGAGHLEDDARQRASRCVLRPF